jgi:hypothetical protein
MVFPDLSWYIKHSLIRGSAQDAFQLFAFPRHLVTITFVL